MHAHSKDCFIRKVIRTKNEPLLLCQLTSSTNVFMIQKELMRTALLPWGFALVKELKKTRIAYVTIKGSKKLVLSPNSSRGHLNHRA